MLTAVTGAVQDPDGPGSFSYQWIRVDGDGTSNPANIGENSKAYLLAEADLGKRVQVMVDFTDGSGFAESLTSEASPSSGAVQPLDVNLVSNLTQSGDASALYTRDHGQAFTTGTATGGYPVTGVSIISEDPDGDAIALQICGVNPSGHPTTNCTDLTAPRLLCGGTPGLHRPEHHTADAGGQHDLHVGIQGPHFTNAIARGRHHQYWPGRLLPCRLVHQGQIPVV